ncbi:MAG: hypothetical protein LBI43_04515 [Streptococcaceae bacterium]|jgi:phosphoribosylanthranilate isomerase|nr:hypothetical protein [Streptococcaceae bacterium]
MNIKICGNRSAESVEAAVEAGATHLGFIMSLGFKRTVPFQNLQILKP